MCDPKVDHTLYTYPSLDLTRQTLRLIRLVGGNAGQTMLTCEMIEAFFDDDKDMIPYYALSYTWGSNDKSEVISIDGHRLRVTSNLYTALRHLHHRFGNKIFWIDAICINQLDYHERTHQVGQMSEIFRRASKVVVWLDSSNSNTEVFMRSLKLLQIEAQHRGCKHWSVTDERWRDMWEAVQPHIRAQEWYRPEGFDLGAWQLLNHSWFRRVWILQEVAFSSRIEILCGEDSVLGHVFVLIPKLIQAEIDAHCQVVLDIFPGSSRNSSWWAESRSLSMLLRKFRQSQATDPRDHVYAVIGMCTDDASKLLEADYREPLHVLIVRTFQYTFGISRSDSYMLLFQQLGLTSISYPLNGSPETSLQSEARELFNNDVLLQAQIGMESLDSTYRQGIYFELFEHLYNCGSPSIDHMIGAASAHSWPASQSLSAAAITPRFKPSHLVGFLDSILAGHGSDDAAEKSKPLQWRAAKRAASLLFLNTSLTHLVEEYVYCSFPEEPIRSISSPTLIALMLRRTANQILNTRGALWAIARNPLYPAISRILCRDGHGMPGDWPFEDSDGPADPSLFPARVERLQFLLERGQDRYPGGPSTAPTRVLDARKMHTSSLAVTQSRNRYFPIP